MPRKPSHRDKAARMPAGVAVIYARYSSDNQRDASIDDQLRECRKWADAHGITVVGEYCDRAISGRTDDRPQFQRMIADAEAGAFTAVIMYQTSRFARNRFDAAMYKRRLKNAGVAIHYACMDIPEGPEGILLESLMEGLDEYYSANLSMQIRRGQEGNALKGQVLGGTLPFGLRVSADRTYEQDPITAPYVLKAYQMIDDGAMQKDVIDYFNAIGLRTTKGNAFSKGSMATLLSNRKYIGEYRYHDILLPDAIPPIVPVDLYERVQIRLSINHHVKGGHARSMENFYLTGKLYCGHCGAPMVGDSGTSRNGATHYYYSCACRKRSGECNKKSERRRPLEIAVVKETIQHVLQPQIITAIIDRAMEIYEQERRDDPALAALLAEQKSITTSLNNLLRAIEAGIFTPSTKDRLLDLEAQKKDVAARLSQHQAVRPQISRDHLEYFLSSFIGGDPDSADYRRKVIETLVHKVVIHDLPTTPDEPEPRRRVEITYNITDNNLSSFVCSDTDSYAPPYRTQSNIAIDIHRGTATIVVIMKAPI